MKTASRLWLTSILLLLNSCATTPSVPLDPYGEPVDPTECWGEDCPED